MTPDLPLTDAIMAVTNFLVSGVPLGDTLDRVAHLVQDAIPPAVAVGITLVDDKWRPATFISTTDISSAVDQAQYDHEEGPCLDTYREQRIVRVDDTRHVGDQWPRFSRIAVENGVRASLSLPLTVGGETYGAINLYATTPRAFTTQHEDDARLFATQAAVVIGNARLYWGAYELAEGLKLAMKSRAHIEQAKGIIMAKQNCGPDQAFDVLANASQRSHVKVRDLARRMVDSYSPPADSNPTDVEPHG